MKKDDFILMLEGDLQDRELSRTYFNEYGVACEFVSTSTEFLNELNSRANGGLMPKILLISMNSFPDNGLVLLKKIRANEAAKHLPVVILGENTQPDLIKQAYSGGANTFINKPFTDVLTDLKIKVFLKYWFEVAELSEKDVLASLVTT